MSNKLLSNYKYASTMFDNPLIRYSKTESFQRRMYLLMLKANEEVIDHLDGKPKFDANFNDLITSSIIDIINTTMKEDQELAVLMMRKEIQRIQRQINNYKRGKVEAYSSEEAKEILKDYTDDNYIDRILSGLYSREELRYLDEDIKLNIRK